MTLPRWFPWVIGGGLLASQMGLLGGVLYLINRAESPDYQPFITHRSVDITQEWIDAEAAKLLLQAQTATETPDDPCFQQQPGCALGQYQVSAKVRQLALESIDTQLTATESLP